LYLFFFSSRRRHTRSKRDWSSDVCSSDLKIAIVVRELLAAHRARVAAVGVPESRLLHDPLAALERVGLARDLELQRPLHVAEREIGRASCRERGEKTGEVGAVTKKTDSGR